MPDEKAAERAAERVPPPSEWPREVKRFLVARHLRQKFQVLGTEAGWMDMLRMTYALSWRGEGAARDLIPLGLTVEEAWAYMREDLARDGVPDYEHVEPPRVQRQEAASIRGPAARSRGSGPRGGAGR